MCMSKGAPTKPSYGPCNENHGQAWTLVDPAINLQYVWSTPSDFTSSDNGYVLQTSGTATTTA